MLGAIATFRANDGGPEMLALARLACDVPDEIDDAPVFAAIRRLLDAFDEPTAAEPDNRRRLAFLILAATVASTPDVPVPPVSRRRACPGTRPGAFRIQISRSPVSVSKSSTSSIVARTNGTSTWARPPVAITGVSAPSSARIRLTIPSTCPAKP